MLRLSSLAIRTRSARERLPRQPWRPHFRSILTEGFALFAAGCVCLVALVFVFAAPDTAYPGIVIDFANGHHSAPRTAQGETGALKPQIDPQLAPFLEPGPYGPLPRIAADGELPARRFAHPAVPAGSGPIVSVIVSGLGLNETLSRDAILRLPAAITLGFSPYARHLESLTALARQTGHEYFLEVPLEPFDYPQSDPGPLVLLISAPTLSNLDRMHRAMGACFGYVGLLTTGRARFAASESSLTPIVAEAAHRGLLILDDGRAPVTKMPRVARQVGALAGIVDRRLDERPSADGIALALLEFERLAVEQGRAIGASDLYPLTVDRLTSWAQGLKAKGITLEPVSYQILPPEPPPEPTDKGDAAK